MSFSETVLRLLSVISKTEICRASKLNDMFLLKNQYYNWFFCFLRDEIQEKKDRLAIKMVFHRKNYRKLDIYPI